MSSAVFRLLGAHLAHMECRIRNAGELKPILEIQKVTVVKLGSQRKILQLI